MAKPSNRFLSCKTIISLNLLIAVTKALFILESRPSMCGLSEIVSGIIQQNEQNQRKKRNLATLIQQKQNWQISPKKGLCENCDHWSTQWLLVSFEKEKSSNLKTYIYNLVRLAKSMLLKEILDRG